jgi:hypothetical protein
MYVSWSDWCNRYLCFGRKVAERIAVSGGHEVDVVERRIDRNGFRV